MIKDNYSEELVDVPPYDQRVDDPRSISPENFVNFIFDLIHNIDNQDDICLKLDEVTWKDIAPLCQTISDLIHYAQGESLNFPIDTPALSLDELNTADAFTHKMHVFLDGYYHLNEKKYAQKSFAQAVHEHVVKKKNKATINFNQRFISLHEYEEKQQLVEKAIQAAQLSEEIVRQKMESNRMNAHISKDEALPLIHGVIEKLTTSFTMLDAELNNLGKYWKKQAYEKFNAVYKLYLLLHRETSQYNALWQGVAPKKPGIFNFNKQNKINFDRLEHLQKLCLELEALHKAIIDPAYQSSGIQNMDDIHSSLGKINETLALWPNMVTHNIGLKLSRITTLNTQNENLIKYSSTVDECIHQLNQANIWTQNIEFNSNVIEKYLEEIPTLIERCNTAINSMEEEGKSTDWIGFVNRLSAHQKSFIAKFKDVPTEEWQSAFDAYYDEPLLHALHHPNVIRDQEYAKSLYSSYYALNEGKSRVVFNRLLDIIKTRYRLLSNQRPKVAKMIAKHKKGLVKNDYFKEDVAHMSSIFPLSIHIVNSKKQMLTVEVKSESIKSYSFELVLDHSVSILQKAAYGNMELIPPTEKYGVATLLATALREYCRDFSIMQLKNANILCLWPYPMAAWLAQHLDTSGVKLFNVKGREHESLVECIIESGRKPILLTMDGLLNSTMSEEIVHQYQLMEAFDRIGYHVINVWTVDFLDNSDQLIQSLKEKLVVDQNG